ncbi:hypothetical protein CEUSTIGMA_g4415.t1 [Chlamydomonas eustigma]|uniref:Uncharacterized protein n=1 Tax=Chlamydomonas eustigma TaxID=1157962 RepID=A0A250X1M1_9CHLO|nr:hypothetical protein CEUSTIGMA_g4415.t1 [Chlamydomonas eustigma]|eukprot:GAX76968.1 hypothetical protein CEUSTIGMA_g4415.t1 [Chlamydomonas eustigma]
MADDQHSSIERARLANLAYIANGKNRAEQGHQVTRVRIQWLRDFFSEIEKLKLLPPLSLEMLIPQPQQEKEEVPEEIEIPTLDLESAMKILPHYLQAHFKKYQNMTERANSGLNSATDDSITAMIVENKLKFQRQNMEGRLSNLFTSAENDSVAAAGRKFLIMDFDKRVKAALAIQAAFRRFKLRCDDTVWPSEERRLGSVPPRARDAKARYMLSAADIAKENARVKALHEQEIKELAEASRPLREAEEQLHKLGESKPQTRSGTPNNAAFTSAESHPSSSLLHGGDESTAAGLGGTISAWDGSSSHSALPFTATTSLLGATVSSSPALNSSLDTVSKAGAITAADGILGMSHISGKDTSHAKALLSNSRGESASSAPLPGSVGAVDYTPASGGEVDIYTSVEASNGAAPLQSVGVEESDVQSIEEEEEEEDEAGPVWKVSCVKVIETSEVAKVVKPSAEEIAEAEAREAAAAAEAAARAAAEEAERLEQEQLEQQERLMRDKLAEEASAAEAMQKADLAAAAKQRLTEARKAQRQAEKAAARAARTRAAGLKEGLDEEEQEDEDEEEKEEQEVVTDLMENSQDTFATADKDAEASNKGPQGEGGSKMNPVEWVPRYEVPAAGTRAATPPQPTPTSALLSGRPPPVLQSAQNAVRHQDAGAEQVTAVHVDATQQQLREGRMAKRKAENVAAARAARAAVASGNGLGQEEEGDFEEQLNEEMEEKEEVGEDEDDDEHRIFPPHVLSESSARLDSAQVSHTRSVTSAQQVDSHPSSPNPSPQKLTPTANALVSSTHAAGSSYQGPSSATEPAMNVADKVSSAASVHKSAAADLLVSATGSASGPHLPSVESNVDNHHTLSATIGGPSEQAGNTTGIASAVEEDCAVLISQPHPRAEDHNALMGAASPFSSAALQHFNTEVPNSFAAPTLGRELPVGGLGISSADLHSSPQSSVMMVSEVHADLSTAPPAISEVSVVEKEVNVKDVVEEHRTTHSDDGALQRTAAAPLQHPPPTPSVAALHDPKYTSSDSRRDLLADSRVGHQQGDVIEQLQHAADPLTAGASIQEDHPESRHEEEKADYEECFVEAATTNGPLHDVVQDAQHAVQAEVFVEVNIHAHSNADESNGGNEISLVGLDEGGGVRSGAVARGNSDYPNQQEAIGNSDYPNQKEARGNSDYPNQKEARGNSDYPNQKEGDVRHVTEEDHLEEGAAGGGRRGCEVLVDDAGGDHNADEAVDEAVGDGDAVKSVVVDHYADEAVDEAEGDGDAVIKSVVVDHYADDHLEDEGRHWIRGPAGGQDTTGVADTCVAEQEDVIRRDGQNLDAAAEGVGRVPEHNALEDDLVPGSTGYGDHVQHDQQNGFQHSKGDESDEFGYQDNEEQRDVEGNGDHDVDTAVQNSGDQLDDHADDGVDFVGGEDELDEQGTSVYYEEDAQRLGGGVDQSQGDYMDQAVQDEVMSGNTSSTHDDYGVKVVRRKPSIISVKITAPAVLEGDGTVEAGSYHTSVNDDGGGPASARAAPAIPHPPDMPSPLFFSPRHSLLSNTAQYFSLSRQYTDTQQPSAMTGPGLRAVHQMGERKLSQPLHGPSILPSTGRPSSASTSPTRLRVMVACGDDLDYPAGIMSPSHTSVGSTKRLGVVAAGAASTTSPRSVLRKQEAAEAAVVPGAATRPAVVPADQHGGSIIGMSLNSNAMHHNGVAHLEMPMADPNAWSAWRTLQRSAYIMQELAYVGDHAETFRPGLRFVPEMDTMYHLSNAAAAAKKTGIKQTGSNIIQTTSSLSLPSIQRGVNSHMPHFSRPLYGGTTTGAALLYGSPRRVKMALSPNGRFRSLMPFPAGAVGAEGPGGGGKAAGVRSRSNNVDAAWNQMGAAKLPLLVSGRSQSLGGMMD